MSSFQTTYQICGHGKNYSMSFGRSIQRRFEVTFHSDATVEDKGFELIIGRIDGEYFITIDDNITHELKSSGLTIYLFNIQN